jgi:hypothetical protein
VVGTILSKDWNFIQRVIPVKAGIYFSKLLDARLRGHDSTKPSRNEYITDESTAIFTLIFATKLLGEFHLILPAKCGTISLSLYQFNEF